MIVDDGGDLGKVWKLVNVREVKFRDDAQLRRRHPAAWSGCPTRGGDPFVIVRRSNFRYVHVLIDIQDIRLEVITQITIAAVGSRMKSRELRDQTGGKSCVFYWSTSTSLDPVGIAFSQGSMLAD